ncbi:TraR/DksA C4-type zinc finger protein [bacterium]|nr:TraR/DksA C4-type zinc finger protein [bacterium]MCK4325478.1 TraR/DksA C4-type zinc finger protein [bacterium]MCK4436798.1 TraR/DksA C4-type zinc finger protein [bacterium]
MNKKDKEKLKHLLEKERETLLSDIEHLENDSLNKSQRDASGDLSGYSFHMADMGTDNFEREFTLDLVSTEQKLLYEVDEALRRLKKGPFGLCQQCEKAISHKRLGAVPYARLCIKCKEEMEKR